MKLSIRPYAPADAQALTDIFYDSIHEVGRQHYSAAQVRAWAPLPKNYAYWQQRLDAKPPFVAEHEGQIVGFITLEKNGHIDWTYTHKSHQRSGVASALYAHLEAVARAQGIGLLFVEAALFGKPFFAKFGFEIVRKNNTARGGVNLENWSMQKQL
jgi:putative acetyltransferase